MINKLKERPKIDAELHFSFCHQSITFAKTLSDSSTRKSIDMLRRPISSSDSNSKPVKQTYVINNREKHIPKTTGTPCKQCKAPKESC